MGMRKIVELNQFSAYHDHRCIRIGKHAMHE